MKKGNGGTETLRPWKDRETRKRVMEGVRFAHFDVAGRSGIGVVTVAWVRTDFAGVPGVLGAFAVCVPEDVDQWSRRRGREIALRKLSRALILGVEDARDVGVVFFEPYHGLEKVENLREVPENLMRDFMETVNASDDLRGAVLLRSRFGGRLVSFARRGRRR